MKIGACVNTNAFDKIEMSAKFHFDYVEVNFTELTNFEEDLLYKFYSVLDSTKIPCEAANCFIPSTIKITGKDVDYNLLSEYLYKGMKRAEKAGIKTVVFGSGGAREVPTGFSHNKAYEQLVTFLHDYAAPIAKKHGVQIAVEPLGSRDCNIINTVIEGIKLADDSKCNNVKGLGDIYHMYYENEQIDIIGSLPGKILHAHISHPDLRTYPTTEDGYDYLPFIKSLVTGGCNRCSIEAKVNDFSVEAPRALALINNCLNLL